MADKLDVEYALNRLLKRVAALEACSLPAASVERVFSDADVAVMELHGNADDAEAKRTCEDPVPLHVIERARCAAIARSQEFAPDTVTGTRQAWVRESIARRIERKAPEPYVPSAGAGGRVFVVPEEELEQEQQFIAKHQHGGTPRGVAIGCGFSYIFTASSIGTLVSIKCTCGEALDLSGDL